MDASQIPKMQSREINADGRPVNLPGIYQNKDTGAKFITSEGDEGVAQADAILATADKTKTIWERVGEVPSRLEILEMRKKQEVKDATAEALEAGKTEAEMKALKKEALDKAKAEDAVAVK